MFKTIIAIYIGMSVPDLSGVEDPSQALLLGVSETPIDAVSLLSIAEVNQETLSGYLTEKRSIKFTTVEDKSKIDTILKKTRNSTEISTGEISKGRFVVVSLLMDKETVVRFLITDSDTVVIIKNNGDFGASYPCNNIFTEWKKMFRESKS